MSAPAPVCYLWRETAAESLSSEKAALIGHLCSRALLWKLGQLLRTGSPWYVGNGFLVQINWEDVTWRCKKQEQWMRSSRAWTLGVEVNLSLRENLPNEILGVFLSFFVFMISPKELRLTTTGYILTLALPKIGTHEKQHLTARMEWSKSAGIKENAELPHLHPAADGMKQRGKMCLNDYLKIMFNYNSK